MSCSISHAPQPGRLSYKHDEYHFENLPSELLTRKEPERESSPIQVTTATEREETLCSSSLTTEDRHSQSRILRTNQAISGGEAAIKTVPQHLPEIEFLSCSPPLQGEIPDESVISISEGSLSWTFPADTESQITSAACSPILKPLAKQWRFSEYMALYKSTPGALDGFTQAQFENLVTKGMIVEDERGFRWAANHRYILHREEQTASQQERTSEASQHSSSPNYIRSLFSRPSLTQPCSNTDEESASGHGSKDTRNMPIYDRRGIRKLHNPIPPTNVTPLLSPWHFPPNALYKEAYPNATRGLSYTKLESMVTRGILIASPNGLRDAGSSTYRLLYVGERDKNAKQHVPRITKMKTEIEDLGIEKLPTPIVEEEEGDVQIFAGGREVREKLVRFSCRRRMLDRQGCGSTEMVWDNEGKSCGSRKDMINVDITGRVNDRSETV